MSEEPTTPRGGVAEEILQLTQDALNLANVACHFDKIENYGGAYDYYDKCILNIDEVMSKLPPTSPQWHQLNVIRAQYDDRMDTLKEIETQRNSFFRSSDASASRASRESSVSSTGGGSGKFGFRKKALSQDDLNFTEIDIQNQFSYEPPPPSITDIPYWILRNIKGSILSGAYITDSVFVPKSVWTQTDVKFAGIPAKTTAFEIILRLVSSFENFHISPEEASLNPLEVALQSAQDELLSLQNQLSKPFPYIKEIDTSISSRGTSSHGFTTADDLPSPSMDINGSGEDTLTTRDSTTTNSTRTFSSFVSALSKGVRKYAEVSFHRLAVALPSKLTNEELQDYTQLIVRVCTKTQFFFQLFRQMVDMRGRITTNLSEGKTGQNYAMLQYKTDNILQSLIVISGVMRDVVCEILLRDVEYLLERYLIKTRKSFSRMYWDQDQNSDATS